MPWTGWPAPLTSRCPRKPCLPREGKAAAGPGTTPPGLLRRREGSVPVEFFQDCRVGVFKQPLLGERRGVTGVHEDPVVTFTAVHATAADGVVQGLVLGKREAISQAVLGTRSGSSSRTTKQTRAPALACKSPTCLALPCLPWACCLSPGREGCR